MSTHDIKPILIAQARNGSFETGHMIFQIRILAKMTKMVKFINSIFCYLLGAGEYSSTCIEQYFSPFPFGNEATTILIRHLNHMEVISGFVHAINYN